MNRYKAIVITGDFNSKTTQETESLADTLSDELNKASKNGYSVQFVTDRIIVLENK